MNPDPFSAPPPPDRSAAPASPDEIAGLAALADREHHAGRLAAAAEAYRRILRLQPSLAEAHNNLGNVLKDQGRLNDALAHYQVAARLKPTLLAAHNNLGNICKRQRKFDEAVVAYGRALALNPNLAEVHNNLGAVLREQGHFDQGTAHLQRALALKPDYAIAHWNLGGAAKDDGRFDEARAHFDRALALDPLLAEAHWSRAMLKSFQPGDPELDTLEALAVDRRLTAGQRLYIEFALSKAWDDVGQYDRAFAHALEGSALRRKGVEHDEAATRALFQTTAQVFDAARLERFADAGDPSAVPIFIVGLPRSGSTLVEQILVSHPLVHGGGEQIDLGAVVERLLSSAGRQAPYPDSMAQLGRDDLQQLGKAYLAELPPLGPGKTRMTDKRLGNFRLIGLIRLILPQAKIIHVVRDPVDTCLSCFMHLFTPIQTFAYDLPELGRYYRQYSELMQHWRKVLPAGAMLEVRYEAVVDDLEGEVRRMLDYCGIAWDPACLSFHKTDRPVRTISNVQVRRPLYRTALGRWRRYQAHLGPLLAELGDLAGSE